MTHHWSVQTPGLTRCSGERHRNADRHVVTAGEKKRRLLTLEFVEIFQRKVRLPFGNGVGRRSFLAAQTSYRHCTVWNSGTEQESSIDRHERSICRRNKESPLSTPWMIECWNPYNLVCIASPLSLHFKMTKLSEASLRGLNVYMSHCI